MAYFIKKNNGKLVNVMYIQNVLLRDTNIVYKMKNGESSEELFNTLEEAQARLSEIQSLLLSSGGSTETNIKITNAKSLFEGNARLDYLHELLNLCESVTSTEKMFYDATNLTDIDLNNFDTSKVTNMSYMFDGCYGLRNLDLSMLNTSSTTNMSYMFNGCSRLNTLNIKNFNMSKVTTMAYMFQDCSVLYRIDLSDFDTSKVTSMYYMFNNCISANNINLSNINTSSVTNMKGMFQNCNYIRKLDLSSFNTEKVTITDGMFYECKLLNNLDLSNFDLSNCRDVTYMFYNCAELSNFVSFINLGKGYTQKSKNYSKYKLDLSSCTKLTHDSLMSVINGLYDLNLSYNVANGGTLYTQSLILGSTNTAKLTAEEIAIATNKGWTVS